MNKCLYCICKTCFIAESNGGASGCGNCDECLKHDYQQFCNHCSEYYNDTPPKLKRGETMKKQKSNKRKLFRTAVSLFCSFVMLTISTYTWITMDKEMLVTNKDFGVKASNNLLVFSDN